MIVNLEGLSWQIDEDDSNWKRNGWDLLKRNLDKVKWSCRDWTWFVEVKSICWEKNVWAWQNQIRIQWNTIRTQSAKTKILNFSFNRNFIEIKRPYRWWAFSSKVKAVNRALRSLIQIARRPTKKKEQFLRRIIEPQRTRPWLVDLRCAHEREVT